ncbi:unnamed protein product [Gadus morhua 'NCC']
MQTPEMAEGFSSSPGLMPGSLCVSSGHRGICNISQSPHSRFGTAWRWQKANEKLHQKGGTLKRETPGEGFSAGPTAHHDFL